MAMPSNDESSSPAKILRVRDVLAAGILLWLFATAWDESSGGASEDSVSAQIRLSFFIPQPHDALSTAIPAIFDVDGDGSAEAMVTWFPNIVDPSTNTKQQPPKPNVQQHPHGAGGTLEVSSWTLQIHDLRPALLGDRTNQGKKPFQPKILLQSDRIPAIITSPISHRHSQVEIYPVAMATGQVMLPSTSSNKNNNDNAHYKAINKPFQPPADRTLQYFCGENWHDAAEKCGTPCPSGQSTDCPENQRCFADTPCDSSKPKTISKPVHHFTTPAGGIPSIITSWSGGNVTMHSVTGESPESGEETAKKQKQEQTTVTLKHMWNVAPLQQLVDQHQQQNHSTMEVEWDSVAMTFVDALEANNEAGLVIITGMTTAVWQRRHGETNNGPDGNADDEMDAPQNHAEGSFAVALDPRTGDVVWRSIDDRKLEKALLHPELDEPIPLPMVARGVTSTARRRSHLARSLSHTMDTSSLNCMREYRHSILTSGALPFQFWGDDTETTVKAMHFEHQGQDDVPAHLKKKYFGHDKVGTGPQKREIKTPEVDLQHPKKRHWLPSSLSHRHRHRRDTPRRGKPNVIVSHTMDGIQVRALKNGRSLCHISLQPQTLYGDINHDGKLDSVQLVTGEEASLMVVDDDELKRERQWIEDMVRRVSDANQQVPDKPISNKERLEISQEASAPLCQLLALSGVPTMEELFNADACGNRLHMLQSLANQGRSTLFVHGAPLLLVESIVGGPGQLGYDIVSAANIGVISRYRGTTGHLLWRKMFARKFNETLWEDDSFLMQLGRLDSLILTPPARPIVMTDRAGITIFSASTGRQLATALIAEHPEVRPQILDLNGDGASDVLVITRSAIWGYTITTRAGRSVAFRIAVGVLAMGLMLAVLRNRYGPRPGKRGTDL